jgi:pSer/pThr/pTyr-binding forkhead associated (FHA) protein
MSDKSMIIMIMSGPNDGQKVFLNQVHGDGSIGTDGVWTLVLGRREECDVTIPFDVLVSRQHALLKVMPDGDIWLTDLGSLNGTFLSRGSDRLCEPAVVQPGQLFRLGRTWLRIQPEADE